MTAPEPVSNKGCAIVTGGGRRIGRAIAIALGGAGYSVCVHYNQSGKDAETVASEIQANGGKAMAMQADLSQEDQTQTLVSRTQDALGPVTTLINNASLFERDEVDTVNRTSWDGHMETNLRAPFVLSQAFAAGLGEGLEGNIINLLDQRVKNLTPHFVSYTLSKSGLWTLTRTLALALAPNIRVNAIAPGPVLPSTRQNTAQFEAQAQATPLGRAVAPEEIAHGVLFLLAARSITGQMISLDSGQHLHWSAPGPAPETE
ncbi:MAG: SDR family oxidoreductase [Rhodospirillales bacterium]|jgi:NAD(P)-dependent dehydrogenase (short-subunit alcohol dehydrogenase family)|nr:SDR family oxidoreductase [Rhodospirillales bacterium]MBT4006859.1 SDR family oxidoreductase [Rhodospirillales bacterium]MBT5075935.1 SDR family oxidoreductase [Rhodospirillales bacterium]MBT5113114.1 SDR family oxidoreductase [Rhodospirillales bacterium]MBT5672990.1 SDR family oxidoreductase [Rhodospirillales bacterium]